MKMKEHKWYSDAGQCVRPSFVQFRLWNKSRFGKAFSSESDAEIKGVRNAFPYVLTDADGTNHYFYKDTSDSNKLKDEDGPGLYLHRLPAMSMIPIAS